MPTSNPTVGRDAHRDDPLGVPRREQFVHRRIFRCCLSAVMTQAVYRSCIRHEVKTARLATSRRCACAAPIAVRTGGSTRQSGPRRLELTPSSVTSRRSPASPPPSRHRDRRCRMWAWWRAEFRLHHRAIRPPRLLHQLCQRRRWGAIRRSSSARRGADTVCRRCSSAPARAWARGLSDPIGGNATTAILPIVNRPNQLESVCRAEGIATCRRLAERRDRRLAEAMDRYTESAERC